VIGVEGFGLLSSYSVAESLPWSARPTIPDPADVTPGIDEDVCVRCRKGNHESCVDYRAVGSCCCEVTE
jgi:hypothetical protein